MNTEEQKSIEQGNAYTLESKAGDLSFYIFDSYNDPIATNLREHNSGLLNASISICEFLNLSVENTIVLDIGANLGIFCLPVAKKGYKTYAFEAGQNNCQQLRRSVSLNNLDVHVIEKAVTKTTGVYKFTENGPYGQLVKSNVIEGATVEGICLDDWYESLDCKEKIRLIKMDIEGGEPDAIKGMKTLLTAENYPLIYMEVNTFCLALNDMTAQSVFDLLKEIGYWPYLIRRESDSLEKLYPYADIQESTVMDYLMVHKDAEILSQKNIISKKADVDDLFFDNADKMTEASHIYAVAYTILRYPRLMCHKGFARFLDKLSNRTEQMFTNMCEDIKNQLCNVGMKAMLRRDTLYHFIRDCYKTILYRDAEPQGLSSWMRYAEHLGSDLDALLKIEKGFLESPERRILLLRKLQQFQIPELASEAKLKVAIWGIENDSILIYRTIAHSKEYDNIEVLCFLDDDCAGETLLGLPIMGWNEASVFVERVVILNKTDYTNDSIVAKKYFDTLHSTLMPISVKNILMIPDPRLVTESLRELEVLCGQEYILVCGCELGEKLSLLFKYLNSIFRVHKKKEIIICKVVSDTEVERFPFGEKEKVLVASEAYTDTVKRLKDIGVAFEDIVILRHPNPQAKIIDVFLSDDAILIYTQGKVGTNSFSVSTQEFGLVSMSTHLFVTQSVNMFPFPLDSPVTLYSLYMTIFVQENLHKKEMCIISGTRDPLSRIISLYFHQLDIQVNGNIKQIPNDINTIISGIEQLLQSAITQDWFDEELNSALHIDVYQYPFDHSKGYQIIRQDKVNLLIIRLENLSDVWETAIMELLGEERLPNGPPPLVKRNEGDKKITGNLYKEVVSNIKLDPELIEQIYSSKQVRHFYTEEEIARFKQKWLNPTIPQTNELPLVFKDIKVVFIEITSFCNLHCKFCPSDCLKRNRQHINREYVERALKELHEMKYTGVISFQVLGEPLLNPDLFYYFELCDQYNLTITLTTNGFLITPEIFEKITKHKSVVNVIISLQTIQEEDFNAREASVSWDDYLGILKQLIFFISKNSSNTKLFIAVVNDMNFYHNDLFSYFTPEKFANICDMFLSWADERYGNREEVLFEWINQKNTGHILRKREDLLAFARNPSDKLLFELLPNAFIAIEPMHLWPRDEYVDWLSVYKKRPITLCPSQRSGLCRSAFVSIAVLSNGNITGCCFDYEGELSLGHMETHTLAEIVTSEQRKLTYNHPEYFAQCRRCRGSLKFD